MRILASLAALSILLAGCAGSADELLPIPQSIKGASRIEAVDVSYRRGAVAAVAELDGRAGAGEAFTETLRRSILQAAKDRGLTAGRSVTLRVEIDAIQMPGTGAALVGKNDQLQGSVYLRDSATGEGLGQLYIDIDRNNGGLVTLLARGGNVRESLAAQFGREIADALGGGAR